MSNICLTKHNPKLANKGVSTQHPSLDVSLAFYKTQKDVSLAFYKTQSVMGHISTKRSVNSFTRPLSPWSWRTSRKVLLNIRHTLAGLHNQSFIMATDPKSFPLLQVLNFKAGFGDPQKQWEYLTLSKDIWEPLRSLLYLASQPIRTWKEGEKVKVSLAVSQHEVEGSSCLEDLRREGSLTVCWESRGTWS